MSNQKKNPLIRLYIINCAIGFVLSAIFIALLLWFDVMGLGGLISRSEDAYLAVFVMWVLNGTVFGSVQFAIVIMGMAEKDDDGNRGTGLRIPMFMAHSAPAPIDKPRTEKRRS